MRAPYDTAAVEGPSRHGLSVTGPSSMFNSIYSARRVDRAKGGIWRAGTQKPPARSVRTTSGAFPAVAEWGLFRMHSLLAPRGGSGTQDRYSTVAFERRVAQEGFSRKLRGVSGVPSAKLPTECRESDAEPPISGSVWRTRHAPSPCSGASASTPLGVVDPTRRGTKVGRIPALPLNGPFCDSLLTGPLLVHSDSTGARRGEPSTPRAAPPTPPAPPAPQIPEPRLRARLWVTPAARRLRCALSGTCNGGVKGSAQRGA